MKKKTCCTHCDSIVETKYDTYYTSANSMGRPRGAKGSDDYTIWYYCPNGCIGAPVEDRQIPDWFDNPDINWQGILPVGIDVKLGSRAELLDPPGNYIGDIQKEEDCTNEGIQRIIAETMEDDED